MRRLRREERKYVSIHAPARGATLVQDVQEALDRVFQSTRPRGARRDKNPVSARSTAVSIHAPARGATADISR